MTIYFDVLSTPQIHYIFGGRYKIQGIVDRLGVVGKYNVLLYLKSTGSPLLGTFSGIDGTYSFVGIKYIYKGYYLVAFDNNANPLNAAISDLITPELMP